MLHYAIRHGHQEELNEILPKTMAAPSSDVSSSLGSYWFGSWVGSSLRTLDALIVMLRAWCQSVYRDAWTKALLDARLPPPPGGILHKGGASECVLWHTFAVAAIADIGSDLGALLRIPAVLQKNCEKLQDCGVCKLRAQGWRWRVQQSIAGLPRFRV